MLKAMVFIGAELSLYGWNCSFAAAGVWAKTAVDIKVTKENKNEIFNALETIAIRKDCRLASDNITTVQNTNVLICIDGLDEDIYNEENWFNRINEAIEISNKYKRVRFVFSAREYFYNNQKLLI